jgi:hypothetical protein
LSLYQQSANNNTANLNLALRESGSNGWPTGAILSSGVLSSTARNAWVEVPMSNFQLVAGKEYHINISSNGNPKRDLLALTPNESFRGDTGSQDASLAVLRTNNSGSSWTNLPLNPAFIVRYSNGSSEGTPYNKQESDNADFAYIYGSKNTGQVFYYEGATSTIGGIGFYLRKTQTVNPQAPLEAALIRPRPR